MKGPTERTLGELRKQGYRADVVERWIPQARQRKDLFGIIDVVAIGDGQTLGVQCTSVSNMAARVSKMREAEVTAELLDAGWKLVVWGWRSKMVGKQKRWVHREVEIDGTVMPKEDA